MAKLSPIFVFVALFAFIAIAASQCPETGTHLIPHNESCAMFYQCVEGVAYEKMCPPGLHFNPSIASCDYVIHAACDPRYKVCPANEYVFLRYPDDCTKFIECISGHPTVHSCPAGLYYNENIINCDYPEHVNCK